MAGKIVENNLGRSFKMGRKRAISRGPHLSIKNYFVPRVMPAPPETCDYTKAAETVLGQILGNDKLGDCTAAAAFHISGTMLANAGDPQSWSTLEQVVPFYSATGGYIDGKESTDNGANEIDVLNYWQERGLLQDGSHKIRAWATVDSGNKREIQTAIWLCENVYFGVEMPDAWINPVPMQSGFKWDIAGGYNPDNGHAFAGLGYNKDGVIISTWGMLGTLTWAAIDRYAAKADGGELYTVLSDDVIERATAKANDGLRVAQINRDINTLMA
jgi:hypothetical protein